MLTDRGFAGASAHRESLRQSGARDAARWRAGAVGEGIVGRLLAEEGVRAVHDRRIPGSDANIDHLAVTPAGVLVIDAKNYAGRPRVDGYGGSDPTPRRLFVDAEEHTPLVFSMKRQVRIVEDVLLGARPTLDVPVRGVLCFVGADWDLVNGYLVAGVGIVSRDGLAALLRLPGPLDDARIDRVHRRLGTALEPA
jgi:hypothetical protein